VKRVLFLGHSGTKTGAPFVLLHLLRWLRENSRLSFELLLVEGGPLQEEYASVCRTRLLESTWARDLGARGLPLWFVRRFEERRYRQLVRRLSAEPFDAIYANTLTLGRLTMDLTGAARRVVTHVHEMEHWIERTGTENFELVRRSTARFLAASRAVRENLVVRHGVPSGSVEVVHEFIPWPDLGPEIDRDARRRVLGISASAFVVVGSGHETWRKGKDLFVQLALECRERLPGRELAFRWVGGWEGRAEESRLHAAVRQAGLESFVRFVGHVENPLDYFASADAFAMVSREDPFPLVCLEAAAVGTPVVCFEAAGGTPELVEHDAGISVPYLDVVAMARALAELAHDEPRRIRLGRRASQKVRERHEVGRNAARILEILESEPDPASS
jgi:glycosyltransferase involved in cell wall biosynthesis